MASWSTENIYTKDRLIENSPRRPIRQELPLPCVPLPVELWHYRAVELWTIELQSSALVFERDVIRFTGEQRLGLEVYPTPAGKLITEYQPNKAKPEVTRCQRSPIMRKPSGSCKYDSCPAYNARRQPQHCRKYCTQTTLTSVWCGPAADPYVCYRISALRFLYAIQRGRGRGSVPKTSLNTVPRRPGRQRRKRGPNDFQSPARWTSGIWRW